MCFVVTNCWSQRGVSSSRSSSCLVKNSILFCLFLRSFYFFQFVLSYILFISICIIIHCISFNLYYHNFIYIHIGLGMSIVLRQQ